MDSLIEEEAQMNAFEDMVQRTIIKPEIYNIRVEVKKRFIRMALNILNQ
jgi:hypothetical protein